MQDQIAAGWYSRMDANTVKKTEEIRKQAETELGIVSSTPALPDFLPGLNIGPAFPQVAAAKRVRFAPHSCTLVVFFYKVAKPGSRSLQRKRRDNLINSTIIHCCRPVNVQLCDVVQCARFCRVAC